MIVNIIVVSTVCKFIYFRHLSEALDLMSRELKLAACDNPLIPLIVTCLLKKEWQCRSLIVILGALFTCVKQLLNIFLLPIQRLVL
jgi:hypothetical protein